MGDQGIDVRLNTSVTDVTAQDASVSARSDVGDDFRCDVLLWTAGRCHNTQDMGLEALGVGLGPRGLVEVNEQYQTSVPTVYAAGDVIGFPARTSNSMEQGRIAACHMFGIDFKTKLAATMPYGLYTIPALSTVGLTEQQAAEDGRDAVAGRALYRYNVRGRMLGEEQGIMKCVFDRRTRRLLGATIVGEAAPDLIHLAQFVISRDGGIDDFIDGCFNYPTLSELYKYAAYDALQAIASSAAGRAEAA
jgi:NAD(P) transhydrogenase